MSAEQNTWVIDLDEQTTRIEHLGVEYVISRSLEREEDLDDDGKRVVTEELFWNLVINGVFLRRWWVSRAVSRPLIVESIRRTIANAGTSRQPGLYCLDEEIIEIVSWDSEAGEMLTGYKKNSFLSERLNAVFGGTAVAYQEYRYSWCESETPLIDSMKALEQLGDDMLMLYVENPEKEIFNRVTISSFSLL